MLLVKLILSLPNHETAVSNHWTGLLEWTTGLALKIILILRFNYIPAVLPKLPTCSSLNVL